MRGEPSDAAGYVVPSADDVRLPSLVRAIALCMAGLAGFGALSWFVAPVLVAGVAPLTASLIALVPSLLVCSLVYYVSASLVGREMRALVDAGGVLLEAARAPGGHVMVARGKVSETRRRARVQEVDRPLHALEGFLTSLQRWDARRLAWLVAWVHDIKAPIAACANTVSALTQSATTSDVDLRSLLERVSKELRLVGADVQRMLDAVRLDQGDIELTRERVDLADVAQEVCARQERHNRTRVTWEGRGEVLGDRTLLLRAIDNLTENAVRYARSSVHLEVLPGLIRIADDGTGLPAPLDALSQPFRSDPVVFAGVRVAGGAGGIGMFFARRVLELHGGQLVAESSTDSGTVFLAYVGRRADA